MASVSDQEFRQMKKFMNDSYFTCTDEWLMACVNWIKENNSTISFDVWKRELTEQWKDANLQEMESSCLPLNLGSQRVVKLSGKYGLQVNSVRDIGESSYSQWIKLKKLENENVSVAATDSTEYKPTWQPTPKRCLYLTMTDGKQEVFGLEMQPVAGLNLNLKPGFKVIICGPVDSRRGVIHLKPNNIRIVGGEVEDLLESNRIEKILADTLNLTSIPATQPTQGQQSVLRNVNRHLVGTEPTVGSRAEIMGEFPDSEDTFPDDDDNDDDIFMEIDEVALLQSTSTPSTRSLSQMTTQKIDDCSTKTITFTEDIEDFEDDPDFTDALAQSTNVASSRSVVIPASSNSGSAGSTGKKTSATTVSKSKPVFVPPAIVQPRPPQITGACNSNANQLASSKSSTKALAATKSSIVSASAKLERAVGPTAFRSAKSALNTNNNSSKQVKINKYMKPMPVIIDPPTPERQLIKRRRKSEEQGTSVGITKLQNEVPPIKEELDTVPISIENAESHPNEEDDFFVNASSEEETDASLQRIVDETLESKLLESCKTEATSARSAVVDSLPKSYPIIVSEFPFLFIMQIKDKLGELVQKRKVVNVRACVSTVVSNIQVDHGSWTLCVCVNDGTGYLNCKISANILTRIIGFTPEEMKKIKAEKTKEGKQKIAQGMNNLAKELVHLNAIFAIELGDTPMITEIIGLKLHHSAAVKDRLAVLGL